MSGFLTVVDMAGAVWHLRPEAIMGVREVHDEEGHVAAYELYVRLGQNVTVIPVTDPESMNTVERLIVRGEW